MCEVAFTSTPATRTSRRGPRMMKKPLKCCGFPLYQFEKCYTGWRFAFLPHDCMAVQPPRRARRRKQTGIAAFVETVSSCTRTTCNCINQPRAAFWVRMQTAAARHRDCQSHLHCQSHREPSKARESKEHPGIAKSHLKLPKCDCQRWQIPHPALNCNSTSIGPNCREDRVQLSRRSGASVAIQSPGSNDPCIEPSGIRRPHEGRRNPRISVYLAAFGKTSGHTTSGTHSRSTSHLRSYAQRQSVARERFQGRLGVNGQHAPQSDSGGALRRHKVQGTVLNVLRAAPWGGSGPKHNGLSKAS